MRTSGARAARPNSGSDLPTTAHRGRGGQRRLHRQLGPWTTLAQDATHIFLLVRTDKPAKNWGRRQLSAGDMTIRHPRASHPQHRGRRGLLRGVPRKRAYRAPNMVRGAQQRLDDREACSASSASSSTAPSKANTPWRARAGGRRTPGVCSTAIGFVDRYTKLALERSRPRYALRPLSSRSSAAKPWGAGCVHAQSSALKPIHAWPTCSWTSWAPTAARRDRSNWRPGGCADFVLQRPPDLTILAAAAEIQRNILAANVLKLPA